MLVYINLQKSERSLVVSLFESGFKHAGDSLSNYKPGLLSMLSFYCGGGNQRCIISVIWATSLQQGRPTELIVPSIIYISVVVTEKKVLRHNFHIYSM